MNTLQQIAIEQRSIIEIIEKAEGRKVTEREFAAAKRLAQIAVTFPRGFRRYRVRDYERGEFRAK